MDIKDIPFFKSLNESTSSEIINQSTIYKYKLGQPIVYESKIPNSVSIIIEGQARLLSVENNETITVAKLGPGSIVGLSSLLRAKGSETINASSELKTLSIPDHLILKLYKDQISFREFCNANVFPGEILSISKILTDQSIRSDINLRSAFNAVLANSSLISFNSDETISCKKNFTYIISSNNIENQKPGEIYYPEVNMSVRPPFAGRILELNNKIYNEFFESNENKLVQNEVKETIKLEIDKQKKINAAPFGGSEISAEALGQNFAVKSIEVKRAKGEIGETLSCLETLSQHYKTPFRKDSIEKILRDEIRRGKKPSIELCSALMSMLGLHSVKAEIVPQLISQLPTPSLIEFQKHFCVVIEANAKGVTLSSPKEGRIQIKLKDLEKEFGSQSSVMIVERKQSTPNVKFGINWFLPSLKKYKGVLLQVLLASFIVQLFGLANPLLIQVIIDKVISQRSLDTLQILGIALVFVTILGGVLGSLRTFLFAETTNRIDARLGSEVIDHLLRLPLNYFDKRPVGELGSRVAELERIREFLTGQALTTILDAAFSVIYIIVMVIYSWLLTFIALGVLPIQILLTLLGSPLLRRQIRQSAEQNAKTQSHLVEILTGVQTVKAQNVETVSRWKWQELYGKYISHTFEKTITTTALGQTSQVLQQLSQLLVLWIGASLVLSGQLTLGQLIAFRIISGYVTQPLLRLSSIWQSIQELRVSFDRLADIIDTPEESPESDKANIPLPEIKGEVIFKDVSFAFKQGSQNILNNINLTVSSGQFIGIAGQSGSGKSTLMKLLPRLYEIDKGKILIDKYDVSKVELYSLRRQVGIVPQDPLLFSGSVSENIAITNPEISSDEIVKAAKIADAHNFIMDLPMGYSTNVGERGSALSGGQKQRIAIARTLISRPKLLIMDEATSALDYETERRVCENLRSYYKGSTVFFITHRLSTIRNADVVVMMHQGSISEVGSHQDLLDKKGRYFALFRQQEGS